jgi:hypothetical protein
MMIGRNITIHLGYMDCPVTIPYSIIKLEMATGI